MMLARRAGRLTAARVTATQSAPRAGAAPGASVAHSMLPQGLPDLVRGDGNIQVAYPQMPERVHDRVGDRGRRSHRRRFAHALGAEGMVRRGRDGLAQLPL